MRKINMKREQFTTRADLGGRLVLGKDSLPAAKRPRRRIVPLGNGYVMCKPPVDDVV